MSALGKFFVCHLWAAVAITALYGASALAQDADEQETDESPDVEAVEDEEVIEEITVSGRKPGSRRRVDEEYEDPVRAQLLKDFYAMQEDQEEYAWRAAAAEESSSRVSWGYNPQEEYRMRNQMALQDLPSERTKPATLFRVEF